MTVVVAGGPRSGLCLIDFFGMLLEPAPHGDVMMYGCWLFVGIGRGRGPEIFRGGASTSSRGRLAGPYS